MNKDKTGKNSLSITSDKDLVPILKNIIRDHAPNSRMAKDARRAIREIEKKENRCD